MTLIRNFGPMFWQRFGNSFSCLAVVGLLMTTYSYAAQLRSQRRLDFELYRRVPQTSDRNMSRELVNKFYELKKVDEKQRFDELMKALREYSQDKDDEKKRLDTLREALHGLDELDKEEKNEESAPHAHPHLSDRRSELQRVLCDGLSDSECKKRRDELREGTPASVARAGPHGYPCIGRTGRPLLPTSARGFARPLDRPAVWSAGLNNSQRTLRLPAAHSPRALPVISDFKVSTGRLLPVPAMAQTSRSAKRRFSAAVNCTQ